MTIGFHIEKYKTIKESFISVMDIQLHGLVIFKIQIIYLSLLVT